MGKLELGTHQHGLHVVAGSQSGHNLFVLGTTVGAQFSHVAEHGHFVFALERLKVVEGHTHA